MLNRMQGSRTDPVDELVAAWRAELPEVDLGPLELSKRVARLTVLLDGVAAPELSRLGPTKAEYQILATLRSAGPPYRRRQNELAQSLLLSSGGTTNVVHRLVAAGLVVREPDPGDRRGSAVRLTDDGVTRIEEAVLATNAAHADLLARLGTDTTDALTAALRDALRTLDRPGHRR
jgi:DNA-binding MarR family transcriptional regulator